MTSKCVPLDGVPAVTADKDAELRFVVKQVSWSQQHDECSWVGAVWEQHVWFLLSSGNRTSGSTPTFKAEPRLATDSQSTAGMVPVDAIQSQGRLQLLANVPDAFSAAQHGVRAPVWPATIFDYIKHAPKAMQLHPVI